MRLVLASHVLWFLAKSFLRAVSRLVRSESRGLIQKLGTTMTGYGHTEFLKSLVTTYNPQEHAKTPILSYTPEYRILPKLNIPLSCSHFY